MRTRRGERVFEWLVWIAAVAALSAAVPVFAGTNKTGGGYEIMSDTISKAGMAPATGGTMTLYQTVGQQAGNTTATGGTMSLTGGFLGVVDETAPAMAFTTPQASTSTTGVISVTGTVFDENGSTWIVSYGPGASPSAWKQINSGSTNLTASSLASWDASGLWGTYTLKIQGTDGRGNTGTLLRTVNIWNADTFTATIPADQWTMISLPGIPQNPDPASFLGSTRYEAQRWDPTVADNEKGLKYQVTFSVTAGDAFWIKPYKTPITYSLNAWVPDTTTPFNKHLNAGWNQIGVPYNRATAWNLFQFKRDGDAAAVTMATAIANAWVDSNFFSYSTSGYQAHDASQALDPFTGYFVYTQTPGTLILDPGAGMPGGLARIVRPVYEWKMQIAAETAEARDGENFIGIMKGASDAFGREDSAEPPTIEPYVSVYIEQPAWGRATGRFSTDIRAQSEDGDGSEKSWPLVVKTSEPDQAVTLTLPDAAQLPDNYSVRIRDLATGAEFDPRTTQTYAFNSGARGERRFLVTAAKTAPAGPGDTLLSTGFSPGWTLFSVPLEITDTDVRSQLGDTLAHVQVYQYFDRRLFDQNSADHVDIQAGIGYWAHADTAVQAQFRGWKTPDNTPVEVPLAEGWNIIGNPFETDLDFGDNILLFNGTETLALSRAVAAAWIDDVIYAYDAGADAYVTLPQGDRMTPWKGYAIKAHTACTLIINK